MQIIKSCFIDGASRAEGTVVLIDIFRAYTAASYMLAGGAERIIAVEGVDDALAIKKEHPDYLIVGEDRGLNADVFDFDNSPTKLEEADIRGRTIIHRTSNGTLGILSSGIADEILLGSFTTCEAIASYVKRKDPDTLTIVSLGDRYEGRNSEDWLFADYLEGRITGKGIGFDRVRETIRSSEGAKYLVNAELPYLRSDFDRCMSLDRFGFAMRAERQGAQALVTSLDPIRI